jgi:hypothetical protein
MMKSSFVWTKIRLFFYKCAAVNYYFVKDNLSYKKRHREAYFWSSIIQFALSVFLGTLDIFILGFEIVCIVLEDQCHYFQ